MAHGDQALVRGIKGRNGAKYATVERVLEVREKLVRQCGIGGFRP